MQAIRPPYCIDFSNIDTHGIEVKYDEGETGIASVLMGDDKVNDFYPYVDLPDVKIYIEKRNWYCDRGRYGFWAESKNDDKVCIDFADGFPRYFFSLQRAFDEMHDWIEFRQLNNPK